MPNPLNNSRFGSRRRFAVVAALTAALLVPMAAAPAPAPANAVKKVVKKNKRKIQKNRQGVRDSKRKLRRHRGAIKELKGASGEQGPQGPKGDRGPRGPQGPAGQIDGSEAGGDLNGTYPDPTVKPGAIGINKLADGAVEAAKLVAGAVTTDKLADGAVNSTKVADDSLTGADIKESSLGKVGNADALDGNDSGDFQQRVDGACTDGSISSIDPDGGVSCHDSGYEVVTGTSSFDTGGTKLAAADCPTGKMPIAGGGRVSTDSSLNTYVGNANIGIWLDMPNGQGWQVGADNMDDDALSWRLTAHAVCVDLP